MNRVGRSRALVTVFLTCGVLLGVERADACMHPPRDASQEGPESVTGEHVALIYWEGGTQHLFVTASLDASADWSSLGWVIPVPEVPESYGTADSKLFDALDESMNLTRHFVEPDPQAKAAIKRKPTDGELKVFEAVETGPYEITPLQATGRAGLKKLQQWLEENGFRVPSSKRPASFYVREGWTFLAVRIEPAPKSERVAADGRIDPLHVSFDSRKIVYPLKFETNQGEFPVTLYVATPRPMTNRALEVARGRGFRVATVPDGSRRAPRSRRRPGSYYYTVDRRLIRRDTAPEPVVAALDQAAAWEGTESLRIRTFHCPALNRGAAEPDDWESDMALPAPTPQRVAARRASSEMDLARWEAAESASRAAEQREARRAETKLTRCVVIVVSAVGLLLAGLVVWSLQFRGRVPPEFRNN